MRRINAALGVVVICLLLVAVQLGADVSRLPEAIRTGVLSYFIGPAGSGGSGSGNNGFGYQALDAYTSGEHNNAFGYRAASSITTGSNNNANGCDSLFALTTGVHNNAFGCQSLAALTTGNYMTAVGGLAGYGAGGNEASTVDTHSTFIGYNAGRDSSVATATPIVNATAIGYGAKVSSSNSVVIGNGSVTATTINGLIVLPIGAILLGPNGISIQQGTLATPEGSVTANPGSTYHSTSGAVYRKNSGTGATGWVAM